MKAEISAVAIAHRQREQRRLGQREDSPRGGIGGVSVRVMLDKDVVGVIAAEEEQANQRLIIPIRHGRRT